MPGRTAVKDRLLDAAAELFYSHGVAATGIDAITAKAGVAKMSLYNNYSSKAELVNAYIQRRHDQWLETYRARLAEARTPQDRVLAVFDSYIDHAERAYAWGFRGCGLLNAAAELPVGDPGRVAVAAQKEEAEHLFKLHLREIEPKSGKRVDDKAIARTAEHLSFVLEGAMQRAGLEGHDARLQSARKIAIGILQQL
jgi:AcrR family transcriptional regulator